MRESNEYKYSKIVCAAVNITVIIINILANIY